MRLIHRSHSSRTGEPRARVVLQHRRSERTRARRGLRGRRRAGPHVNSAHFKKAIEELPQALAETSRVISTTIKGASDWSRMGELTVDERRIGRASVSAHDVSTISSPAAIVTALIN